MGLEYNIYEILSISIIGVFCYPFLRFIENSKSFYLFFGISLWLVDQSTKIIKQLTKHLGPLFIRPIGANKCDVLCATGNAAGNPGFPSGHCSTAAFFFTMLYIHNKNNRHLFFGIFYVLGIAMSRYKMYCHNELQIIAGIMYGIGAAILFSKLIVF